MDELQILHIESNHLAYELLQTGDKAVYHKLKEINDRIVVILQSSEPSEQSLEVPAHGS